MDNSLSRSPSRINSFNRCNRKYFFNYYKDYIDFDKIPKKGIDKWNVFLLKKLKDFQNRSGDVVHKVIASFFQELKVNRNYTIEQFKEKWFEKIIEQRIREPYYMSAKRDYTQGYTREDKKIEEKYGIIGLVEHYYNEIPEDQHEKYIAILIDNIQNSLEYFGKSKIYKEVKNNYDNYEIFHESPKTDFDAMKFTSKNINKGETTLFVQPDFYVKDEKENKFIIVDRKTGDSTAKNGHLPDQLLAEGYRVYVENGCDDNLKIEGYYCNLEDDGELNTGDKVGVHQIKEYEKQINDEINKLCGLLVDKDPIKNIPLPMENYPETDDIKKCEICAFRSICNRP